MVEVKCSYQTLHGLSTGPFCSYLVPNPFQSQNIIDLFPFEGANFHFRLKVPGSVLDLEESYLWIDIVADLDTMLDWNKIVSDRNFIEVRVLVLDAGFDEDVVFFDDETYQTHINECMAFLPGEERAHHSQEAQNKASSASYRSNNQQSFTDARNPPPQTSQSAASTGSGKPLLDLENVQKGATNLWNAFKATAEKIPMGFNQGNASISSAASANLNELSTLLMTTYQDDSQQHGSIMVKLWEVTFPDKDFPEPVSGGQFFESNDWKQCGWQKPHPSHDLKSSGLLALRSMVYFGERCGTVSLQMINANRANTKQNYPYAIVAVNLTLLLGEIFSLRDKE